MSDLLDLRLQAQSALQYEGNEKNGERKMAQVKTPKDLAKVLNMDEKSVRNILRKITTEQPGSGGRWNLTSRTTEEWIAIFAEKRARKTVVAELK